MNSDIRNELLALATDWDRSMVENDAEAIGRYMADEWTIIGSDGRLGNKATFLELVKSGVLSHDEMTSEEMQVRVYGDTAVTISRGISGGAADRPWRAGAPLGRAAPQGQAVEALICAGGRRLDAADGKLLRSCHGRRQSSSRAGAYQRMKPTVQQCPWLRLGGVSLEDAVERRFVRAARSISRTGSDA
jgi:hypothetical protein